MGDSETAPRWLRIFGTDCREGDLLRIVGEHYRVVDRTYPPVWSPVFRITLPDGSTMSLGKSSTVEIFDPDGSVASRVMEIPR
jgi:hypothetical protein